MRSRVAALRLAAAIGVVSGCLSGLASSAWAGSIAWNGPLVLIQADSGTGEFTGGIEGVSPFTGSFSWPDTCGPTCTVEPFPPLATNYVFSDGAGSINGVGGTALGIESSIEVINEEVVDQERIDYLDVFGVTATLGQTIDTWALNSQTAGEFTPGFVNFGISYIYLTTDPFSNTAFRATPPPNPDLIIWGVEEADGDRYAALGEVTGVPEPAGHASLALGTLGLLSIAAARRKS